VTLQLVEVTLGDGHLTLKGPGRILIPVSENRFRIAGQNSEITFGEGEHAGFERRSLAGGRPVAFEWKPAVVASPAMLAVYAGEYYSEELDARYRVTATDTTIAFRTGTSDALQARPVFPDTFDWNGNDVVQFTRSGGQVTGFEVTNARMRRVKFVRLPTRRP